MWCLGNADVGGWCEGVGGEDVEGRGLAKKVAKVVPPNVLVDVRVGNTLSQSPPCCKYLASFRLIWRASATDAVASFWLGWRAFNL